MRKPLTGEPYAGEPHVRFGGRGRREPFSTPIVSELVRCFLNNRNTAQAIQFRAVLKIIAFRNNLRAWH